MGRCIEKETERASGLSRSTPINGGVCSGCVRGGPWQEKKKMDTMASGVGYISPLRVFFPMCLSTVE